MRAEAAGLEAMGIAAHLFDRGRPLDDARGALDGATHLVVSVPPDGDGDPVLDHHAADIAATAGLGWIGYLSTTGVYGDRGGAVVDEETPPAPGQDRSVRRLAAEAAWRRLGREAGIPVVVFRLAGIYGPGRSAFDQLRAGTARRIVKPGQAFSRVHVADIVGVIRAAMAEPRADRVDADRIYADRIYNVCDDEPAPSAAVVAEAARLLGVAPPPEEPYDPATLTPMARSFFAENRRVANGRIKTELGYALRFPSYREGLAAILAADG
ncbi:MAG: NAD-dependent epimerase/dehydratase family protein [Alphaproteobacteria bacterium]|nr:NAD-dependent epimerase/dehydratase family protein [Alphaproteobacteria bacterium]